MTSEILAMVLQRLDDLGVYERVEGGPIPFGLFDAHDTRLQVPFLEKANTKLHDRPMWKICIGLPNGTSKWQVGDSKQQNGCWKMSMTREKDKLVAFKRRHGFKNTDFQRLDIVPLVVRAWASSFARTPKNKDALMERGWYHLDKRLLRDPEILRTKVDTVSPPIEDTAPSPPIEDTVEDTAPSSPIEDTVEDTAPSSPIEDTVEDTAPSSPIEDTVEDTAPSSPIEDTVEDTAPSSPIEDTVEEPRREPEDLVPQQIHVSDASTVSELDSLNLNFVDGIAGTMTTDLMTFLLRKQKIHEAYEKRKEEGQRVRSRLQEALKGTRLTGGALFKVRKVVLCDEVLEVRRERDAAIQNTKMDGVVKLVERYNKRLEKYSTVIASTKKEQEYTVTELKAWLAVRKKRVDGPMPSTLAKLKELYEKLQNKEALTLREHLLDEGHSDTLITLVIERDGNEEEDRSGGTMGE
jgi:cation transport regulator ChaC